LMDDQPEKAMMLLSRVHQLLLAAAALTVLGAVAGVQGWLI